MWHHPSPICGIIDGLITSSAGKDVEEWQSHDHTYNWLKLHRPLSNVILATFIKIQNIFTIKASISFLEAHIPEIKAVQRLVCRRAHGHTVALFVVFSFKEKKRKMQKRGRQESERG